jgi:hypothetical protein
MTAPQNTSRANLVFISKQPYVNIIIEPGTNAEPPLRASTQALSGERYRVSVISTQLVTQSFYSDPNPNLVSCGHVR